MNDKLRKKALMFEYTFHLLDALCNINNKMTFFKMSKIFFLIAAIKATEDNHGLLDYFDNFYCGNWGASEGDIIDIWINRNFEHIRKYNEYCELYNIDKHTFDSLTTKEKEMIRESVKAFMLLETDYISMDVFGDVYGNGGIIGTHLQWTAIQVANEIEEVMHGKGGGLRARLSTDNILNSAIKAF